LRSLEQCGRKIWLINWCNVHYVEDITNFLLSETKGSTLLKSVLGQFSVVQMSQPISLRNQVQTGFGAHPASYPKGNRGFFPGGIEAGV